jgi:hypothetical protein
MAAGCEGRKFVAGGHLFEHHFSEIPDGQAP